MKYVTTIEAREYTVEILDERHVAVDGVLYEIDWKSVV